MRRWLKWATRLYPAAWRARYAREFDALLDDLSPRRRDLWDIFRGAIVMQLSTPAVYLKLGAATAVLGALVAGGVSLALPRRYVSSAVLRIALADAPAGTQEANRALAARRLSRMQQEVLSRRSLAEMIQQPALDLYRGDRTRYPLEDIIQSMRRRDLRIEALDPQPGATDSAAVFRVSFEYPDPATARKVVRALVTRFTEANVATDRAALRQSRLQKTGEPGAEVREFLHVAPRATQPAEAPVVTSLEVLDPAGPPVERLPYSRLGMVGIGLGAGFALGLLIAFLRGRPWRWIGWMAASAIAGFAAALGVALYGEFDRLPFACLGAAAGLALAGFRMRDRAAWRPLPIVKSALAGGAFAAILAGFASFAIPDRYVSTVTMQADRQDLHRTQSELLSRSSLSELIQRPSLDLYRADRRRRPLEEIVRDMRRDIRIQAASGTPGVFTISFEYSDRHKARAVVRELATRLIEQTVAAERAPGNVPGSLRILPISVLDPASDPQHPVAPDRLRFAAAGLAAGIVLGLLAAFMRRRPPGQAWAMLRFAAAGGVAGALVAGAIAFAVPSRYVSTAVLRAKSPGQSGDRVRQLMMEVLSRQALSDEVRRGVQIQSLEVGPGGNTVAFSISYESSDPEKAHSTVQTLVSKFVEPNATFTPPGTEQAGIEVLDAASIPDAPSFPARAPIAAGGLLAGLLLGPVVALRRRRVQANF